MKKVLCLFALVMMVFVSLAGCSNSGDEKSEEELKAEIRAELEAEMTSEADMNDMDALYEFVKQDVPGLSREDFDLWEVSYLDVTGDGNDEVIFASVYGLEWPQKMQVISGDSGEYKQIPSDILLAKYENTPGLQDGFLTVYTRTGGSGVHTGFMNLYVYNGSEIVSVLEGLIIEDTASMPGQVDTEATGVIDGRLTDFVYTLTEKDNMTGKQTIKEKVHYTYNPSSMSFDEENLNVQASGGNQGSAAQTAQGGNNVPAAEEESEVVRLSGFSSETIRGVKINYSDYSAVVVPWYPSDGANHDKLAQMPYVDWVDNPFFMDFAVFGKLQDVKITYQEYMDAELVVNEIGDLENCIVTIHGYLPTDMSYYGISGRVHTGEGYYEEVNFGMDDMRDESAYEVYTIK